MFVLLSKVLILDRLACEFQGFSKYQGIHLEQVDMGDNHDYDVVVVGAGSDPLISKNSYVDFKTM